MGGLSSIARLGTKGLKKYLLDYKFKSPPRYEGGRNIGPLETMASTKEIEAPSLQDAKKLLKEDSSYIRDRQKLKDEIGEEANPRVSFDRITEDGNIIKEAASKKRFRLEQEARVLPYLEPQNLPITNMGDKESFLPTINKIINDPKLNETQKNKIIGYVNQYTDGLITPEELYNKSLMATKEATSITDMYKKSNIVKEQLKGTGFKDKPITELEQSIKNIDKGKQTVEGHAQLVEKLKPIRRWETSPTITQAEEIPLVLQKGKYFKDGKKNPKSGVYSLDLEIPEGQRTQARLDIPAYESYNKWIASLKTPGGKSGTFYSPTAVLKNVKFKPQTARAKKTGKGELPKEPFGVMDGEWVNHDPNQIKQLVDNILKENLEYVQVGYDPRRHGHFYIREDFGNFKKGTAIEEAEEVIQLGPLVLARNPKFSNVKEYEEGGRIMKDPNKNYNAQRFI